MRILPEDRARPVQLVALGGPADGKLLALRDRWHVVVMETYESADGLSPLRSPYTTLSTRQHVYTTVKLAADRNLMTAAGQSHYRVLVPSELATRPGEVEALVARTATPTVDGGYRHGKTGRPGDGCTITGRHEHRCGTCHAAITFAPTICQRVLGVPPCHCGSTDWRSPRPAFPDWIWP